MSENTSAGMPLQPHTVVEATRRTAEWLLVNTIPDIERRLAPGMSRYEVLGLAPILRRTLLDRPPVFHVARKRLKIAAPSFRFTPYEPQPVIQHDASGERRQLVLALADGGFALPGVAADIEGFVGAPVGQHLTEPLTVKTIIRYFAHVHGGVHVGPPEDDAHELMQTIGSPAGHLQEVWMRPLRAIAAVTVETLRPVSDALMEADPDLMR